MIKDLSPTEDRLLVKRVDKDDRVGKERLIYLPEDRIPPPSVVEVLAVGPGKIHKKTGKLVPISDIEVGDLAVIGKFAGTPIDINGDNCLIVFENDVLGLVEWS